MGGPTRPPRRSRYPQVFNPEKNMTTAERLARREELDKLCPRLDRAGLIARFSGPPPQRSFYQMKQNGSRYSLRRPGTPLFSHLTPEQQKQCWERFNRLIAKAKAEGKWPWSKAKRASVIGLVSLAVQHPRKVKRFVEIRRRVRQQYAYYKRVILPELVAERVAGSPAVEAAQADHIEGL